MIRSFRHRGLAATHPGKILREDVLPALNLGKAAFARRLGLSRQMLYDILGEKKGVTAETALRLARLLGTSAEVWTNLQRDYDLNRAAKKLKTDLRRIQPVEPAL